MKWKIKSEAGELINVEMIRDNHDTVEFLVNGKPVSIKPTSIGPFHIYTDQTQISLEAWTKGKWRAATESGLFECFPQTVSTNDSNSLNEVHSPMPGRVLKIFVKSGDKIQKGSPLIIIEAMKMENEIRSSRDGIIDQVVVSQGQSIDAQALLIKFKPQ